MEDDGNLPADPLDRLRARAAGSFPPNASERRALRTLYAVPGSSDRPLAREAPESHEEDEGAAEQVARRKRARSEQDAKDRKWVADRFEAAARLYSIPEYEFFVLLAGYSNTSVESILAPNDAALELQRREEAASARRRRERAEEADANLRADILRRMVADRDMRFAENESGEIVVVPRSVEYSEMFARQLRRRVETAAADAAAAGAGAGAGAGTSSTATPSGPAPAAGGAGAPAPAAARPATAVSTQVRLQTLLEKFREGASSVRVEPAPAAEPARPEWLQRPDVSGLIVLKPTFRAGIDLAYRKVMGRGAGVRDCTLMELMTHDEVKAPFAQLASIQVSIITSRVPKRYMPPELMLYHKQEESALLKLFLGVWRDPSSRQLRLGPR